MPIDISKITVQKQSQWGTGRGPNGADIGKQNAKHSQKEREEWDGAEELHIALKASKEIAKSQSLYQFIFDLKD